MTSLNRENSSGKVAQDWDPKRYQTQHDFVWKYGSSLIDILDPQQGETVLDLGCGTGELANEISLRTCGGVMGIDADPQMIAQASQQFPDVDFRVADASSFAVDEPVDAIFSNAALHWVTQAENCVKCMAAALKVGTGRLVIELGGNGNVQEIANFLDRATSTEKNPWYFPSIAEYSSILERHGIEVLNAQLYDRPTPFLEGDNGLRNWILMFGGSHLDGLNKDEVESVLTQAEVELRSNLHDGDQWVGDYRRLRIVGRRLPTQLETEKL